MWCSVDIGIYVAVVGEVGTEDIEFVHLHDFIASRYGNIKSSKSWIYIILFSNSSRSCFFSDSAAN